MVVDKVKGKGKVTLRKVKQSLKISDKILEKNRDTTNCQHSLDHQKKQESSRETSISALLAMPKPLTVWNTINFGKF